VGPRTGLEDVERGNILPLSEFDIRTLSRSLYRLRYSGNEENLKKNKRKRKSRFSRFPGRGLKSGPTEHETRTSIQLPYSIILTYIDSESDEFLCLIMHYVTEK
jgi:hypothetical protein